MAKITGVIHIGDKVKCRFYNKQENKFYGDYFTGEVIAKETHREKRKPYLIKRDNNLPDIYLHRNEIIEILTSQ